MGKGIRVRVKANRCVTEKSNLPGYQAIECLALCGTSM